jgi:hypothetical protein
VEAIAEELQTLGIKFLLVARADQRMFPNVEMEEGNFLAALLLLATCS